MVNREQLKREGLRAYEAGRLRMASRATWLLAPTVLICALGTGRSEACACVGVVLLAASVLLRWRDRRGVDSVRYGLPRARFRSQSASWSRVWRQTARTLRCFPCARRPVSASGCHRAFGWVVVLLGEKRPVRRGSPPPALLRWQRAWDAWGLASRGSREPSSACCSAPRRVRQSHEARPKSATVSRPAALSCGVRSSLQCEAQLSCSGICAFAQAKTRARGFGSAVATGGRFA